MNNNDRKFGGRLIDIVLITTIATLTVFIIIFTTTSNEFKFQNASANSQTANQSGSGTVNSNVEPEISSSATQEIVNTNIDGIRLVNETLKDSTKPYSIQYVKTNFESVNTEINKYISDAKNQYENIIRLKDTVEQNETTTNLENNLKIEVEMYPHQDQYLSLVFTKNVAVKSNTYDTSIYTLFFNLETGSIIDFQQILNDDENHLTSLSDVVRYSIVNNHDYQKHINQEALFKVTEPKWIYFKRFAIIEESLVLYFNKGEIGNSDIGVPMATIPLSSIYPLLSKEFQTGIENHSVITNPPPQKESSSNTGKKVALTFDDGPHPTVTTSILDTLDKYDAKATFFVVGNRVEKYADIVIETLERGHEIGNHTWNHENLTKVSSNQVMDQINATNVAIHNVLGEYPTVFRPPYGAKNDSVISVIDLPVVMWTIDTLDWKYRDSTNLLPSVQKNMHNNAIILMHDIHQSTADGLESVLKYLQDEGYEFVTVSEILQNK
ncbi:polysaccharide deacetylase family protein [Ureibacillus acetophenoni]|uniref:Peptidoglycan/xylan/chitin deacetylase (PgdA/CDA1 family) n=1 Tax=Ureibacillus acetophenoni TaxID=614649 RepID=A0A285UN93_9BACL|nr:polysaccharide deacetylase family protein [Ureibacillus acetophenoni]SOC43364.1 peptidoglycan/xylan/chitin deacetylase (PgdA/CDA1 family) [Ureibacillus acetophenoni]